MVVPDICKVSDRVWHHGLLHRLKYYGISSQIFGLISFFLSNRWLQVSGWEVLTINTAVPQGSILGPTLSYYTLMTFLMMLSVILQSMLMAKLSILNVIRRLICGNN